MRCRQIPFRGSCSRSELATCILAHSRSSSRCSFRSLRRFRTAPLNGLVDDAQHIARHEQQFERLAGVRVGQVVRLVDKGVAEPADAACKKPLELFGITVSALRVTCRQVGIWKLQVAGIEKLVRQADTGYPFGC